MDPDHMLEAPEVVPSDIEAVPPVAQKEQITVRLKSYGAHAPIAELPLDADETVFGLCQAIDKYLLTQEVCMMRYFTKLYVKNGVPSDNAKIFTELIDEDAVLQSARIDDQSEVYIEGPVVDDQEEGADDATLRAQAVERMLSKTKHAREEMKQQKAKADEQNKKLMNMIKEVQASAAADAILCQQNDRPIVSLWKALSGTHRHNLQVFLQIVRHPLCGMEMTATSSERGYISSYNDIEGATPFHLAVLANRSDVAKLFASHGANVLATYYYGQNDALKAAISNNNGPMVKLLLTLAQPDQYPTNQNNAMLEFAITNKYINAALAFVNELHPSLNLPYWFHRAADADQIELIKVFLGLDSNLINSMQKAAYGDGVDREGSVLHKAAANGFTGLIYFLVEQGCDYRLKDSMGATASEIAKKYYFKYNKTEWNYIHHLLTYGFDPVEE